MREDADSVASVGLGLEPANKVTPNGPHPGEDSAVDGSLHPVSDSCEVFVPALANAAVELSVPPNGILLMSGRTGIASVQLRRFATTFGPSLGTVAPRSSVEIPIARDVSPVPWQVRLVTSTPTRVCGR